MEKKDLTKITNNMKFDQDKEKTKNIKINFTGNFKSGVGHVKKDSPLSLGKQVNPTQTADKGHESKKFDEKVSLIDGSKAYEIQIKYSQNTKVFHIHSEKQKKKKQSFQHVKSKHINTKSHRSCWHCGDSRHLRRNCKSLARTRQRNQSHSTELEKKRKHPFIYAESKYVNLKSHRVSWFCRQSGHFRRNCKILARSRQKNQYRERTSQRKQNTFLNKQLDHNLIGNPTQYDSRMGAEISYIYPSHTQTMTPRRKIQLVPDIAQTPRDKLDNYTPYHWKPGDVKRVWVRKN